MSKRNKKILESLAGEDDRISSLSDDLLHRIMSFMDTKYAVQTCVLSKRWRSLWQSLPYLYFNLEYFPFRERKEEVTTHPFLGDPEDNPKTISFNYFVKQVLSQRHHTTLVNLVLYPFFMDLFHEKKGSPLMGQKLIAYALDHKVQQLSIFWDNGDLELPEKFYTCQSLEALSVAGITQFPKFLALPALKSLHFEEVWITQNFFHQRSFSGCPNLETLIIIGVWFHEEEDRDTTTLFISAPNLKRLELELFCERICKENISNRLEVVIDAPRLATFQYCGYAPIVYSSDDLASTDVTHFDISNCYKYQVDDDEKDPEYVLRSINTLQRFRHTKSLTLSLDTVQVLAKFPSLLDENRIPFSNLKYLKICLESHWMQRCDEVDIPGCVLNFFLNSSTKFKFCKRRYIDCIVDKVAATAG